MYLTTFIPVETGILTRVHYTEILVRCSHSCPERSRRGAIEVPALSKSEMEENTNQPNSVLNTSNIPSVLQNPNSVPNSINPPAGGSKSKLPILLIGIILFLLIAGSAAGFYVYKKQNSKMAVKPTPSPAEVSTKVGAPDPTANWKTYTNSELGFSFNYPKQEFKDIYESTPSASFLLEGSQNIGPNNDLIANFLVSVRKSDKSADEFAKEATTFYSLLNTSTQVVIIDGINGVKLNGLSTKLVGSKQTYNLDNDYYFFKKGDHLYSFAYLYKHDSNDQTIKLLDQIISTFKFTNNQTATPSPSIPTNQTTCNLDGDCPSDSTCMAAGPLIAGQAPHKICVKKSSTVPL